MRSVSWYDSQLGWWDTGVRVFELITFILVPLLVAESKCKGGRMENI